MIYKFMPSCISSTLGITGDTVQFPCAEEKNYSALPHCLTKASGGGYVCMYNFKIMYLHAHNLRLLLSFVSTFYKPFDD